MRILSVGSLPPEWGGATIGGVATFHQTFLNEIKNIENIYSVEIVGVIALNWDRNSELRPPACIPFMEYPEDAKEQKQYYQQLLKELNPDVVQFHHIGHRWAKWHVELRTAIPSFGTIHFWHQLTHRSEEHIQRASNNLKFILPGITGLIFPSTHTLNEGESLGLSYSCPTQVIPNTIHPLFLDAITRSSDKESRYRNGIVFVGSLITRKRADMVIRAAATLQITLTIIGEGTEMGALKALSKNLGVADHVVFTGGIAACSVIPHLEKAALLCVPSTSESYGIVYQEALACGTPVVGFKPTLDEITTELGIETGIGVSGDCSQEELTSAIKKVLETNWDRNLLRQAVAEHSTPAIVVKRYVDFIRQASRYSN